MVVLLDGDWASQAAIDHHLMVVELSAVDATDRTVLLQQRLRSVLRREDVQR